MKNDSNVSELERLREQVEELSKLSAIGELSAGIAHEIQNPLNFVINFSKMSESLLKDFKEVVEEESEAMSEDGREELEEIVEDLETNLSKIKEHGERANSIVQNIMLFIRGKKDEVIPTDIPKLVKEYLLLSYHASRAADKSFNVSFVENYDSGLEAVKVIPQDLSRAILNVLNNAFYAMKQKYAIQKDAYKAILSLSVKKDASNMKIIIEDNGMGMTDETKEHILNQYFTTKPVGEGTGLGLMLTKRVIEEKHHGKIEFESEYEQYTRFTFTLPLI